jgi:hypothetical protein
VLHAAWPLFRGARVLRLSLVLLLSLAACRQGEDTGAWCRSFESATTAFLDVSERIPEGTDPAEAFAEDPELAADAEEAGRKMQDLMAMEPPDEIEEDFRILTTTLPPDPAQSTDEQEARYQDALEDVQAFVESECDLDPALLEQLSRTGQ